MLIFLKAVLSVSLNFVEENGIWFKMLFFLRRWRSIIRNHRSFIMNRHLFHPFEFIRIVCTLNWMKQTFCFRFVFLLILNIDDLKCMNVYAIRIYVVRKRFNGFVCVWHFSCSIIIIDVFLVLFFVSNATMWCLTIFGCLWSVYKSNGRLKYTHSLVLFLSEQRSFSLNGPNRQHMLWERCSVFDNTHIQCFRYCCCHCRILFRSFFFPECMFVCHEINCCHLILLNQMQ